MKKYLLSLTLSLLFIPIVLWGQNTSAKSLSSRLDTLIKYDSFALLGIPPGRAAPLSTRIDG